MIRKLEIKDLPYMYEWMHDDRVTKNLQNNFSAFTEEMVRDFIEKAMLQDYESSNLHYAIIDENDEYMGTISLKNIDRKNKNAEYAIVTRFDAHGKGYAGKATEDILRLGFDELGLEKVYLYVSTGNIGANKFYRKFGFTEEGIFRKHLLIGGKLEDIRWYSMLKEEMPEMSEMTK